MDLLRPAAHAFDATATAFDTRFGAWKSVAAQRRAVRSVLLQQFPQDGRILELGGGTGEDAVFLAQRGFNVLLTDPSPNMATIAGRKLLPFGSEAVVTGGEDLEVFADRYLATGGRPFDGAFSNFAPLNCVADLAQVARGLSRLLKPGSAAILVLFGTFCPGEMLTELLRGRSRFALRRFHRTEVPASLGGREFRIVYHRLAAVVRAFSPWFVLERRIGIGVSVPPSAAEPWISQHPWLLKQMEALDSVLARPLAILGDHVLYQLRRTAGS